jgi:uncharacterized protein (TIGR02285 family)
MTVEVSRSAVIVSVISLLSVSRPASTHETINWLLPDVAPAFIREGDQAGEGFGDRQLGFLIEQLADVDHRRGFASTSRIWYQIEHADGTCTLTARKTPSREKVAVFSQFGYWVMPDKLIVRSDRVAAFGTSLDSSGQIDLSLLSQNENLTGAYESGVGYGAEIEQFISDPRRRSRLDAVANLSQPIRLLSMGRIDFIFGTSLDIEYSQRLAGIPRYAITALDIKDVVSPREEWGYVACSNQGMGRSLMARIDAILAQRSGRIAYLEPLRRWYGTEDFETAATTGLAVR